MRLKIFFNFMIAFLSINLSLGAVDLLYREPNFDQDNKLYQQIKQNLINLIINGIDVGINFTLTRPECMPLRSENIDSNPYHPSLVSIPGAEIRRGFGIPIILEGTGIDCKKSGLNCSKTISKSFTLSLTDSYSISYSNGQTYSESISNSVSNGKSDSKTKSIGKTIENSFSISLTHADEKSFSDQISNSLQKTMEKSTGISFGQNIENSQTDSSNQEESFTKTENTETDESITDTIEKGIIKSIGGGRDTTKDRSKENCETDTAGVSGEFMGIGASYSKSLQNCLSERVSNSEQSNWNNQLSDSEGKSVSKRTSKGNSLSNAVSIGRTNSNTKSFGSSSSKDNRVSDAISVSSEIGRSQARSFSNSTSATDGETNSLRLDDSFTSSNENSISNNHGKDNQTSINNNTESSRSISFTRTIEYSDSFNIGPGQCVHLACKPYVNSAPIPFQCINEEKLEFNHVEYMKIDENNKRGCVTTLIDCEVNKFYFEILNKEFNSATSGENALEFKKILKAGKELTSKNGDYILEFLDNGNLVLKRNDDTVIWQNQMDMLSNYSKRIRINEKGHLIEEVKGLFSETAPNYRENEWITVWSSAPINHNVTIGLPNNQYDRTKKYILIVQNNGELNLYDSVGVKIWCVQQECNHRNGYKFPETYLVPTNMITPEDKQDKHNFIRKNLRYKESLENLMFSIDKKCSFLNQNEYLMSKNKRFKLILEDSGNLIIKDGNRTMWESLSANLSFARPPYKMFLSSIGKLIVLDKLNRIVWHSVLLNNSNQSPFILRIHNEGKVDVVDRNKVTTWESWPTRNLSFGFTELKRKIYIDENNCFEIKNQKNSFTQYVAIKVLNHYDSIIANVDECKEECDENKNCIAISIDRNGKCYFFNNTLEFKRDKNFLTFSKNGTMLQFNFKHENLRLINLNQTLNHNISTQTADECVFLCRSTRPCNAINFNNKNCFFFANDYLAVEQKDWTTNSSIKVKKDFYLNTGIRSYCQKYTYFISMEESIIQCNLNANCSAIFYSNNDNNFTLCMGGIKYEKDPNWSTLSKNSKIKLEFYESNLRLFGHYDLKLISVEECLSECLNDAKCNAVSYQLNKCFMFNLSYTSANDSNWKTSSIGLLGEKDFNLYENIKFINPIYTEQNLTDDQCLKLCVERKCERVSFSLEEKTCELFEGSEFRKKLNWKSFSKTSLDLNKAQIIYEDLRLFNYYHQSHSDTIESCMSKCQLDSSCLAINYKNSKCYYFDKKYIISNEKGWQSFFKKEIEQTKLDYFFYKNIHLNEHFEEFDLKSINDCILRCRNNINCLGISIEDDVCYLYNSLSEFQKEKKWISYTKKQLDLNATVKIENLRLWNSYKMIEVESWEQCWNECSRDFNCSAIGFSLNWKECYFSDKIDLDSAECHYRFITVSNRNIKNECLNFFNDD